MVHTKTYMPTWLGLVCYGLVSREAHQAYQSWSPVIMMMWNKHHSLRSCCQAVFHLPSYESVWQGTCIERRRLFYIAWIIESKYTWSTHTTLSWFKPVTLELGSQRCYPQDYCSFNCLTDFICTICKWSMHKIQILVSKATSTVPSSTFAFLTWHVQEVT